MALSKRILEKIEERCSGDEAMLEYMRTIIACELGGTKHYTKEYEKALRKYSQVKDVVS